MTDFVKADSCMRVRRALRVVSMLLAVGDRILVNTRSAVRRCLVAYWFGLVPCFRACLVAPTLSAG